MGIALHLVSGSGWGVPARLPGFPLQEGHISIQAMSWVIEKSQHKGSSFVVLLMIANCADPKGANAFPGFEKLARDSRITIRQITNIIPVLERSGELLVQRGAGPHGTNRYTVNMAQERMPFFVLEKIANGKRLAANFQRSVRNQKIEPSPLPPAGAGEWYSFDLWGTKIEFQMGSHKRPPNLKGTAGLHADDVVEFLRQRGYPARIVRTA